MVDLQRLRLWSGLSQGQFAEKLGVKQGSISMIESGKDSPSQRLVDRAIDSLSPAVLFIERGCNAPTIAHAMIEAGQMDLCEHDPDAFYAALRGGKRIIVITNDKSPFIALINQAITESGLGGIPLRGIKINEAGQAELWND